MQAEKKEIGEIQAAQKRFQDELNSETASLNQTIRSADEAARKRLAAAIEGVRNGKEP